MSACRSVFKMMKGSGIVEAFKEAYEQYAVTQMTSGKAIARAIRGLFLIDAAPPTKLVTTLLPTGGLSTMTDIHESVSNEGTEYSSENSP